MASASRCGGRKNFGPPCVNLSGGPLMLCPILIWTPLAIAELGLVGYPVDSSGNALYAGVTWIDAAAATLARFQRLRN